MDRLVLANSKDGMWVCVKGKKSKEETESETEREMGGTFFSFEREKTDGKRSLDETTKNEKRD